MKIKEEDKDLSFWKNNCEEDYIKTPISVLRYITELEKSVNNGVLDDVSQQRELLIAYETDHNCRSRERAEQMIDYYLAKGSN